MHESPEHRFNSEYPDIAACACDTCRSACRRPGWPTPTEALDLLAAGLGDRLMRDYWCLPDGGEMPILSPAERGREGGGASFMRDGRCTFHTFDGRCELHETGLKPAECRKSGCSRAEGSADIHKAIAVLWDSAEGRAVFELWRTRSY